MTRVESFNALVRGLVTLGLVGTMCYGFIVEKVSAEAFVGVVSGVVTFWFASRHSNTRVTDSMGGMDAPTGPTDPFTTRK